MLFTFSVSIFGFAFVFRIFDLLVERKLFSRSELTKIGTALIAASTAAFIALPVSRCMLIASIFVPIFIVCATLAMLVVKRSNDFKHGLLEALSLTLLKMKTGRSFRQAFSETIAESDVHLRTKLSELISVVAFSQQNAQRIRDPFIAIAVDELIKIDRNSHLSVKRLRAFRDKLRIESDFRRRSGQVMSRIRAQSLVMCGLYLAVFAFVVWKFGWQSNSNIMIASSMLFALGAFWIWRGGKKLRWKV